MVVDDGKKCLFRRATISITDITFDILQQLKTSPGSPVIWPVTTKVIFTQ